MPTFTKDMEEAAVNALHNEMLVGGESVNKFEDEFARYIGTDYAAAVNSGSSALLLTFYSLFPLCPSHVLLWYSLPRDLMILSSQVVG